MGMSLLDVFKKKALRESFEKDGFLFLPGFFSAARIDAARAAFTRLLEQQPFDVVVDNLTNGQRTFWAHAAGRDTRHFKFNDLYLVCPEMRGIALDPRLSSILNDLLGEKVVLCNSLNFEKGSGQPKHIDSLFMTPQTAHHLIATWTAFEDVHPDAGPLIYYPGSHTIPLYRFKDGSHHASNDEMPAWNAYIESQIKERGLEEKVFEAKKGDVFIWHSDLLHGGGAIKDHNRTRNSLVCHYYSEPDAQRLKLDLAAEGKGYWYRRLPQPVRPDPSLFKTGSAFPEKAYLARNPDVKAAVEAGSCRSGAAHYQEFGYQEGRSI